MAIFRRSRKDGMTVGMGGPRAYYKAVCQYTPRLFVSTRQTVVSSAAKPSAPCLGNLLVRLSLSTRR
jgi:hypothetical protein